jgi:aerobic carbon-monoxide dehydrogenase medium subunit
MYPREFRYHRASSLNDAVDLLADLGADAKLLAGGQSLIPLMKLRLASPAYLVDLNFIAGLDSIELNGGLRLGPLVRHADLEKHSAARRIPILHDCAAGIADVQVRNLGTIAGSLAEADPTGDWAPVLLCLDTSLRCLGRSGERSVALPDFIKDAFTTALGPSELVSAVDVKVPVGKSAGAYIAFKRCAPVYASASAAVQLTLEEDVCRDGRIRIGAVGLTPIHPPEAEAALIGKRVGPDTIAAAAEAAMAACDPQSDSRGSSDYKRALVRALVSEAIQVAGRRAAGEKVEIHHHYA